MKNRLPSIVHRQSLQCLIADACACALPPAQYECIWLCTRGVIGRANCIGASVLAVLWHWQSTSAFQCIKNVAGPFCLLAQYNACGAQPFTRVALPQCVRAEYAHTQCWYLLGARAITPHACCHTRAPLQAGCIPSVSCVRATACKRQERGGDARFGERSSAAGVEGEARFEERVFAHV